MKIHSLATLTFALAAPAVAGFEFADAMVELIRKKTKVEIFEGVGLPTDTLNLPTGDRLKYLIKPAGTANKDFLGTSKGILSTISDNIIGTGDKKPINMMTPPKRSTNFRTIFAFMTNEVLKADKNSPDPAEGYLYYGGQNFVANLAMLIKTNPFMVSALTLSKDKKYFELNAFSPEPEAVVEPKYLKIMRVMTDPSHRINARFNLDLTMAGMTKFDENGKAEEIPESEWNYYTSGVLFNLGYYSSCVHSSIHILHYLMVGGIMASTEHDKSLSTWAAAYEDNIAIKHFEVAASLYSAKVGDRDILTMPLEDRALTGVNGFGGKEEIKPIMKGVLSLWGSLKNADDFATKFLFKDLYEGADKAEVDAILEKADILTEFKKHMALVEPFAKELTQEMEKSDKAAFLEAEKKLTSFMAATGKGVSSIDSISAWVQLMSCTGIYHGSTLSYTRMILNPEVAMWRDISNDEWVEQDVALMGLAFNTIQGMAEGRHVFTSQGSDPKSLKTRYVFKWNTSKLNKNVQAVLAKYESKAIELKTAYQEEIEKRDDLAEFGWILTDHCNDGYDGKQHTIATYF
jgi:hypothetical protein